MVAERACCQGGQTRQEDGAQLVGEGEPVKSLLFAIARRGGLALAYQHAQGGELEKLEP